MSRAERRARGAALWAELGLAPAGGAAKAAGLDDFFAEVTYGAVWDRPHLSRADRMLCTLAVMSAYQRPQLADMIGAALDAGVSARAMGEVFLQAGLYAGFVTAEAAMEVAGEVFAARGVTLEPLPARDDDDAALDARGQAIMAKLHGERAQGGYAAPDNPITGALYPAAIRYGYGEIWDRPGLDHRERMLVAVSTFCGLGLEGQLRKFGQSALNIGLSREEVVEAVIQTGPYTGFPRALNGLAILSEVLPG